MLALLALASSVALADPQIDFGQARQWIDGADLSQQALASVQGAGSVLPAGQSTAKEQAYFSSPEGLHQAALSQDLQAIAIASKDRPILPAELINGRPAATDIPAVFCADGSCAPVQEEKNTEFGESATRLAAAGSAGKDVRSQADSLSPTIFAGQVARCREVTLGAMDCCANKGWAKDLISHCRPEEKNLGLAKQAGSRVVYLGRFCAHRTFLHICTEHKQTYCLFPSAIAFDVQVFGRQNQLHRGFGGAENPDCSGLSPQSMAALDLGKIDFSNAVGGVENQGSLPDGPDLINTLSSVALRAQAAH